MSRAPKLSMWQRLFSRVNRTRQKWLAAEDNTWLRTARVSSHGQLVGGYFNPLNWILWLFDGVMWLVVSIAMKLFTRRFTLLFFFALLALTIGGMLTFASLVTIPQWQKEHAQKMFSQAIRDQDFEAARLAASTLVRHTPESIELQYQQAIICDKCGDTEFARERMTWLAESKEHPLAALWIVSKDFDFNLALQWPENEHIRFRSLMEIALERLEGENHISAQVVMANYLASIHAEIDALRIYEDVIRTRPEHSLVALRIANSVSEERYQVRFAKSAERYFASELFVHPDSVNTRFALAETMMISGRPKEASQVLNDGYKLNPDPRIASLLSKCLWAWQSQLNSEPSDLLKRLQILQTALRLSPLDPAISQELIHTLLQTRRHSDDRISRLRDDILREAGPQQSLIAGVVSLLDNDFTQALEQLKRFESPVKAAVLNNLAVAISKTEGGNLNHALLLVNEALGVEPTHTYFLETRGQIYVGLSRWEEAIQDLEAAMHAPELESLIVPSLAIAYRKTGREQLAQEFDLLARQNL